ncbi:hypothetical protein N7512_003606, partial [Penicillium capsulatum]
SISPNQGQIETNSNFFRYTSGRWFLDEEKQLERRYTAGRICGSQCVQMTKLPQGLFKKVFSLMENGKEVLARIPNPNAGNPQSVVASEAATLDFVWARRLASTSFAGYGSLYHKDTIPSHNSMGALVGVDEGTTPEFVLGPTTERSFWENEKQELEIDRGPCTTTPLPFFLFLRRKLKILSTQEKLRRNTSRLSQTAEKRTPFFGGHFDEL